MALGYVAGLAASSIAFYVLPIAWNTFFTHTPATASHISQNAIRRADNILGILVTIAVFIIGSFGLFLLTFAAARVLTFLPFVALCAISLIFDVKHWTYFMFWGAVMGVPIALVSPSLFHMQGQIHHIYFCGALGGLTFWWIAVRRQRHGKVADSSNP